jgi:hypothetical protein
LCEKRAQMSRTIDGFRTAEVIALGIVGLQGLATGRA